MHMNYEIGGFQISLDSFPFHESEYLAAFRTECRREPDIHMTICEVPQICISPEINVKRIGETVYRDSYGRRVRVCMNERKDALLYRITELSQTEKQAEITPDAAAHLGSYLVLRWLNLPEAFLEMETLFLHASLVRWKDKAILFTGRKQIGKSTQAELWRKHRNAVVLNGDRALLRHTDGAWIACGSPFCGTSGICCNEKIPVGAIVLLQQGAENRVEPVSLKDAYVALLEGCTFEAGNIKETERVIALAEQIYSEVPMFRLICTPDEQAVVCLEKMLDRRDICG